jgi:hypothetical protein
MSIDRSKWPEEVESVDVDSINRLGIDQQGRLYWNGVPVVTSYRFTARQTIAALIVALASIAGGIGSAVQGWAAYNDWACRVRPMWWSICPIPQKDAFHFVGKKVFISYFV